MVLQNQARGGRRFVLILGLFLSSEPFQSLGLAGWPLGSPRSGITANSKLITGRSLRASAAPYSSCVFPRVFPRNSDFKNLSQIKIQKSDQTIQDRCERMTSHHPHPPKSQAAGGPGPSSRTHPERWDSVDYTAPWWW